MTFVARLRSWLRSIVGRSSVERHMDDEMRFHLAELEDDFVRRGHARAEAHRLAVLEFGAAEARKEDCRSALGLRLVDELRADTRYGLRGLRRAPLFTSVAMLTIGLGIGANAAILSLIEAVFWKPLSVARPHELRMLTWASTQNSIIGNTSGSIVTSPSGERSQLAFSYAAYTAMRDARLGFDSLCAFKWIGKLTAVIDQTPELLTTNLVSGTFFETIGVVPAIGRPILPADDVTRPDGTVAVISDSFWARRFGRDPGVLGRRLFIGTAAVVIVGVNPPSFTGLARGLDADVFLPVTMQPIIAPWPYGASGDLVNDPTYWWLAIFGRLQRSQTNEAAQTQLDTVVQQNVAAAYPDAPDERKPHLRVLDGARGIDDLSRAVGPQLRVLAVLVVLVLALACANLANLVLARSQARQREFCFRLALGASRGRIARQVFTEGLMLAAGGGSLGLLVGYWTRNTIPAFMGTTWEPAPFQAAFDVRVIGLALLLIIVTGVLFSAAPAWRSMRLATTGALANQQRGATASSVGSGKRTLIVVQIALSIVLLGGAGLFLRTLSNLRASPLGFDPRNIVLFSVDPPRRVYIGDARTRLFSQLEERIRMIPGVRKVGVSSWPLVANDSATTNVGPDGRPPRRSNEGDEAWVNDVNPEFFHAMGIVILQGRAFDDRDGPKAPPAAIVNEAFGRKFFPSGPVIGRTFRNGRQLFQVVGLSADARFSDLRTPPPPTFYRAYPQVQNLRAMTFAVDAAMTESNLMREVRHVVLAVDPALPLSDVRSQGAQIEATLVRERLLALLGTMFGVLALVLTAIGVYAVIAGGVAQRTAEIGVRLALGANRRTVVLHFLAHAVRLSGWGLALGLVATLVLGRYLGSLLYGLSPYDPGTIVGALVVVLATSLAASVFPAVRAARLDPMIALRHE